MDLILIVLIVLATLIVLIAAMLLIPVDISLKLSKEGLLAQVRMSFRFLKGIASGRIDFSSEKKEFQLRVFGVTLLRRGLEKKELTDWKKLVTNSDVLYDAGKELAGVLTKNMSLKKLKGKVTVGLSDPAQTGMLIGFLYAGSGMAKAFLPETELEIVPSFEKEQMDADIELRLDLPLFKTAIHLIPFLRRIKKIF